MILRSQIQEDIKMIRITMRPADVAICKLIGQLRDITNANKGSKDFRGSSRQDISYVGMLGEYAFAKHFNLFPDITLEKRPTHVNVDFITNDGLIIDIKASDKGEKADHFCVSDSKSESRARKPDIYVAMTIDESEKTPIVWLMGWCKHEVYMDKRVKHETPTPHYKCDYKHLKTNFPVSTFGEQPSWKRK